MTPAIESVVFLHGLGAGPQSWDEQLTHLPAGFTGIAPHLFPAGGPEFSLASAVAAVRDEMDRHGVERAHLCGLSLGGMIATRFAIDFPNRVASLVLSGSQVHPSAALMALQGFIMHLLPERVVAQPGVSKREVLAILREVKHVDFRAELPRITAPTLVMCGLKDRPNLAASKELAAGIAGAKLQLVPGANHTWNERHAKEFSSRLNAFYEQLAT